MFLDGCWHTIELTVPREGLAQADPLDVTRLQEVILTPLLGIWTLARIRGSILSAELGARRHSRNSCVPGARPWRFRCTR